MKNVTVSLDEETARWVRIKAAEEDMSVSRFLGQLLRQKMQETRTYEQAMTSNMARLPLPLKKRGSYPRREELHDRPRLPR